jgi:outer membrane immunogenic protein
MRKLLITAAAFATLLGTPALAADMPLKAPPPAAPSISWTGFYVGGNVGYSWGDPHTDAAGSGTAPNFNFGPPFPPFPFPFAFTDSNAARLTGAIGGGQIGYNYQVAPRWVLGLEADFQGSGERGSNSFPDQISAPLCFSASSPPPTCLATTPSSTGAITGYEAKIGWFGTVRGRAGFLLTDQILVYGTGGLAYGQVEVSGNIATASTVNLGGIFGAAPVAPAAGAFDVAKTNVGYTVGAGVEGKVFPWLLANWSWKLEYLYLDLGSLNFNAPFGGAPVGVGNFTAPSGTVAMHTHFTDNIVRVGLNYAFGN